MNHLAATRRGSSPELPMQMSTHLLEPAPIMSRETETKAVQRTVGAHTCMCLQGIPSQMRERKKTA